MKRTLTLAALISLAMPCWLGAQSAEEQYVRIFHLIQEADGLSGRGQVRTAVDRYLEAQGALKTLQSSHPNWNERVVNYRLGYIASKLEPLTRQLPAPNATAVASGQTNAVPADPADRIQALEEQIGRLAAQKALLEAKLKEALSAQPASVDPRELAKAQEQLRTLQKENDVLRVTIEQERGSAGKKPDLAAFEQERQILAVVQLQLAQQSALADALRKENDDLKRQFAKGNESEVQWVTAQATIRSLERERTDLNKKLGAANKELAKRSNRSERVPPSDLEKENEALRARLAVLDAERVPYTEEEMALLNQPALKISLVQPVAAPAKKKRELPPGAGTLMAEADRAIDKGRFEEAERKYLEVLRQDENQVDVLSRLAAVQLDQDRLNDAEATLQKALTIDPQDAPCLYLLGSLRFRQGKYDEAFAALSSSARLNPDNAQVQYFLGKTLLEKGNRVPAEAALRKAVQLQPGWGDVHHLLAVVYATQQPPFKELAQWHYQKALDGGYPRDSELDKWMEAKKAAATTP